MSALTSLPGTSQRRGAKEDSIIALFVEQDVDMLAGLLAITKTGATYLPLDPIYPKAHFGTHS